MMTYTKAGSILFSFLLLLSLSGCGMKQMASSGNGESYTVTDATGKEVTIPAKPKRILGNSASIDTMLLSVVTPDKLTAATDADRDPNISYIADETKDIPLTVPLTGLSMEVVTEAKPDLIVASTYTDGRELDLYRNLGIPVVVIDGPRSIDQVKEDVRIIAAAAGEKERGENVISQMDKTLSEIQSRLSKETGKKPVVYLVSQMTRYGGPGSMFSRQPALTTPSPWPAASTARPHRRSLLSRQTRTCSSYPPTAPLIPPARPNTEMISSPIPPSPPCGPPDTLYRWKTATFTPLPRTAYGPSKAWLTPPTDPFLT